MFYDVKELQYNARVSEPDPRFASMLLEQFGGANGELKAAMQYIRRSRQTRRRDARHDGAGAAGHRAGGKRWMRGTGR